MIFRVVSEKEDIPKIDANEKNIHLAFRPANVDFFQLVDRCPKIEVIQIPPSYEKNISKSIRMFLDMQRITLQQGDCWGARADLSIYYDTEKRKSVIL